MKLVVEDAPVLKAAIDAVGNLVEEGLFEVKKDGLHLKAMDPSQISMVSFKMPNTVFLEYNLGEEAKLGLDIAQFSEILSRGKKGEKVELVAEDGRLAISFIGAKSNRSFKMPLLDIGESLQREPKTEFNTHAVISGDLIKEALKDAKLVSSHVRIVVTPKTFAIEVKGDSGEVNAQFEKGEEGVTKITTEHGAKATFPVQYLEDIVKACGAQEPVTISLETDRPLKVEYSIYGTHVSYYLAPRIERD